MESHTEYAFHRNLNKVYVEIVRGEGNYLITKDEREIFDGCSGAAVTCLGYGNKRVIRAISDQLNTTGTPYLASSFWTNEVVELLCKELIQGTGGKMAKVYLTGSGSEAMEAAIKLSRQFFLEKNPPEDSRVNFITREGSYHGNTIGALSVSGHVARKQPYLPLLMKNVHQISSCYPYRQRHEDESDADFVAKKAAELEKKFQDLGPNTVIAFIAEPVVGAALGCVPYVHGYLKALRDICHKYGALFILDEVMCGMGRTGTLHSWQAEDVIPDIQINAKGLGSGYQPIAAMMISEKVANGIMKGRGEFVHGLTYQAMPIQATAALEVQRIIREDNLLENVSRQGEYLGNLLKDYLGNHSNVGDIRGLGLFWAIEFVKDKATKEPFDSNIAYQISDLVLSPPFNMTVYPGTGTVDGKRGDHIILAPPYTVKKKEVEIIVTTILAAVNFFFSKVRG
ncbi:PLP-dependent transferase [Hypoxylon sp. EC38]|nr:PLP-dependent transferase [Hypoxylon sp. EC38]